jgi:predicted ribosome quality control (RQC) complex YloA/Tae2 family protein
VSKQLQKELEQPSPRIYWKEDRAVQFSLAELTTYAHLRPEPFSSVDKGLQVFVRRKLGQHAFESVFEPLERALRSARDQYRSRLETMLNSMAEESRADRYERWGHLLMASQSAIPPHTEEIEVDDLYEENMRTTIPLDPGLNGIENAEKYYEKARQTRKARRHAEDRLLLTEARAAEADGLWQELQGLQSRPEVLQFEKLNAERLAPYLGQQASEAVQQVPFRRFILSSGFEVWVGKNARQNDTLTFVHARKFDFWLHARGVSGSHTLLRRPGRTTMPDKRIKQQAASIAAYYSKARGSHLVPVIMAEKKYVRKPRGAAPGAVIVEKEEVLLVEPGLP